MSAQQAARRPRVRLVSAHADLVRSVLATHPSLSLRKLAPLIAERAGLPHLSDHALHNFLTHHQIERVVPDWAVRRSARLRASGTLLFAPPLVSNKASATDETTALLAICPSSTTRGLGQRPREPAESCGSN